MYYSTVQYPSKKEDAGDNQVHNPKKGTDFLDNGGLNTGTESEDYGAEKLLWSKKGQKMAKRN